jgi:ABC-type antimicrobial peptide transport system permease subunit
MHFFKRTPGTESELDAELGYHLDQRELDPQLALYDIRTIETAVDSLLTAERLVVVLSGFFAVLAAVLAAIGLYGILAREVAVRTREIGIRLALGASRGAVLWTLMRETSLFVSIGAAAGAIAMV